VAKTSEPLLAAGLVISAADYLSHGAVMTGNPAFALGWAWAQALALESSSGVVFVYALSAFRQADKVKGGIYLALALLLAIVGGWMLLLQVNVVTLGSAEPAVLGLNVLRVIVSIAYIFLLRAKSIRFSDLADVSAQPAIAPETINVLVEKLEHLTVTVNQLTNPSMPALPEHTETSAATLEAESEQADSVSETRVEQVQAILEEIPDASVRDVAHAIGRSKSTAHKAMKIAKQQRGKPASEAEGA
jgi:hypothetical protein